MPISRFAFVPLSTLLLLASACADRAVGDDEAGEEDDEEQSPFMFGEQYAECVDGFECVNEWCLSPVDEPGFCTVTCMDVDDCEPSPVGTATPTCLEVAGEAACALDCGDGRSCPPGMRCEQVDAGGERSICF
ncbi:hypothetical protein ACNOYE_02090 [Nannocystaceae bacterium ST9]